MYIYIIINPHLKGSKLPDVSGDGTITWKPRHIQDTNKKISAELSFQQKVAAREFSKAQNEAKFISRYSNHAL